jgi:serine/threonine-protein kinase RsbT
MAVLRSEILPIRAENDVVAVRQMVRTWSAAERFSVVDQTKFVTAASELARNTLVHGGGGSVKVELLEDAGRRGIRLAFHDRGPGIPDIELAMRDGFTTGQGMGLGLGGARRLVSDFEIDSRPGEGTQVTITRWR